MISKYSNKVMLLLLLLATIPLSAYSYEIPSPRQNKTFSDNVKVLQQISHGISEISTEASKAVVFVSISKTIKGYPFGEFNPFDFFFGPQGRDRQRMPVPERKQKGLGSGFIIDLKKGYILTNNHVIENADEISVKLANGETYDGKVLGRDKNTDVAVIELNNKDYKKTGLTELRLGSSADLSVGEHVIALGAPFGLEASLSFGVISATKRGNLQITNLGNFLQTDAAINPGNSGGPLLNTKGEVIGINTAIYSRSGASAGIGFAVPSDLVRVIASQLINTGHVARGYLGVRLSQNLNDDIAAGLGLPTGTKGALISFVQPNEPAAKAGLEAGDVITAVNGKKVNNNSDLTNHIGLIKPGEKVTLEVYRDGKKKTLHAALSAYPDDQIVAQGSSNRDDTSLAGLTLQKVTSKNYRKLQARYKFSSKRGLLVTDIEPGSKAHDAGLRPGDVIVKANRQPVTQVKAFEQLLKKNKKLLLQIERDGAYLFAALHP